MPLPTESKWSRSALAATSKPPVDRQKQVIYGVILAEEGPFKTKGRGEFDKDAIREIVKLGNQAPGGLKSRFTHPNLSADGLGKFLGRMKNLREETIKRGRKNVLVAKGDLHLDPSSRKTPSGDLGGYVMDLAESDSKAFMTSLVIVKEEEYRLDKKGRPATDENGDPLPPLWRPKALHASDIVDDGDATQSFLSTEGLPDEVVRQATELLRRQFAGQPREAVENRLTGFMHTYLDAEFGPKESKPEEPEAEKDLEPEQPADEKPKPTARERYKRKLALLD